MNYKKKIESIYKSSDTKENKLKLLKNLELDFINEMTSQDENMSPEIDAKVGEGLRQCQKYIAVLEGQFNTDIKEANKADVCDKILNDTQNESPEAQHDVQLCKAIKKKK